MVIFGCGFYVGYYVHSFTSLQSGAPQTTDTTVPHLATSTAALDGVPQTATTSGEKNITAPVVIDTASLSDSQKALLSTLGIDAEKVTVTPAMIACAYKTLGEGRVEEIIAGSKPGPVEVVRVLPCMQQ